MRVRSIVVAALAAMSLLGCAASKQPPTPVPGHARGPLFPHKEFRLGTFDFHSESGTGNTNLTAGESGVLMKGLESAIPAMLVSQLHDAGRFSVYEGGNIRAGGPLDEKTAVEYVDAYLSGTITSLAKDQVCFDVRMANAVSHEVLFTRAVCAPLGVQEHSMIPQRDAIKRLADDLGRAIPKIGYAHVTSADGQIVSIDKGAKDGVLRGMSAYVVATGDTAHEPAVHAAVATFVGLDPSTMARTPAITGQLYILSVEDDHSVGILYSGDYVLPRDTVFFK